MMRGYADPLLLIALWILVASAGAWGYVEAKRAKANEQSSGLEPRSSDPERLDLDPALGQPQGVGARQDEPPGRELLEPGRDAGRPADGSVVHVKVAPDRPDDDLAREEPDADLH